MQFGSQRMPASIALRQSLSFILVEAQLPIHWPSIYCLLLVEFITQSKAIRSVFISVCAHPFFRSPSAQWFVPIVANTKDKSDKGINCILHKRLQRFTFERSTHTLTQGTTTKSANNNSKNDCQISEWRYLKIHGIATIWMQNTKATRKKRKNFREWQESRHGALRSNASHSLPTD